MRLSATLRFCTLRTTAGATLLAALPLLASQATTQTAPTPSVAHRAATARHAKPTAQHPAQPQQIAAAPVPERPNWPVNASAEPAKVTWNSQGLQINAANSSLIQILHDYSTASGSKIEGVGRDERIFGSYGPGNVREVLTQLLSGSGYNILMIGDMGEGTPKEIVLSARNASTGQRQASRPTPEQNDDDSMENDVEEPQQPPPPLPQPTVQPQQVPPNMPPGNGQPRTPQQIMEEMQQRQQILQQEQQDVQQHIQQQENPQ